MFIIWLVLKYFDIPWVINLSELIFLYFYCLEIKNKQKTVCILARILWLQVTETQLTVA